MTTHILLILVFYYKRNNILHSILSYISKKKKSRNIYSIWSNKKKLDLSFFMIFFPLFWLRCISYVIKETVCCMYSYKKFKSHEKYWIYNICDQHTLVLVVSRINNLKEFVLVVSQKGKKRKRKRKSTKLRGKASLITISYSTKLLFLIWSI